MIPPFDGDRRARQATLAAIERSESYLGHLEAEADRLDQALAKVLRENIRGFLDDPPARAIEYGAALRRDR